MKNTNATAGLRVACALIFAATVIGSITATAGTYETVPLFVRASHSSQYSLLRIVNHSGEAGTVFIRAVDDAGNEHIDETRIQPWRTLHFTSDDLENGHANKGLRGIGRGTGDWILSIESELDRLEVLAYVRNADGSFASIHDAARRAGQWHLVPFFNPASNTKHVSKLRLIDDRRTALSDDESSDDGATVRIFGVDDLGKESEEVSMSLRLGQAVTITAQQLEGADPSSLTGTLGDGYGKWSLYISSDHPIIAMNLMESGGRLTNLSTSNSTALYGPPSDEASFASLPGQMYPSDWSLSFGGGQVIIRYAGAENETYEIRVKESSTFTWTGWQSVAKTPTEEPGYYTDVVSPLFSPPGTYDIQMRARNDASIGPASRTMTVPIDAGTVDVPSSSSTILLDENQKEPAGIAYANGRLYVLDGGIFSFPHPAGAGQKIFAYHTLAGIGFRPSSSDFKVEIPVTEEGALTFGNGHFLVMKVNIDLIVEAYTLAGERNRLHDFRVDPPRWVDGIVHAGNHVYGFDWRSAFAFTPSGRYVQDQTFDLAEDNRDGTAAVYAGGVIYIVDAADYKVYAYSTTGERVESLDFPLHDNNNDPVGIAYGEGRFFVLDRATARIFQYAGR